VTGPEAADRPVPGSGVLGKAEILRHLRDVADELATRDVHAVMVVAGSSYLALHGLREATAEVDSLTRLGGDLQVAVRAVAGRRGLRVDWVNDKAAMFAAPGLQVEDCEVLYEHTHLTVPARRRGRCS
jgi:hypothetical protein